MRFGFGLTSPIKSFTRDSRPAAIPPARLVATTISATQVNLTWIDMTGDETGFLIQRQAPGEQYIDLYTAAANSTSYSDLAANTALEPNTSYNYRIRANRTGGNTDWSNVASATTSVQGGGAPSDVTGFSVARYTTWNDVYGTWNDQSSNVPGGYIRIMHSVDNVTWHFDGNSTQLDGLVPWAGGRPATPPPGTTYYYRVKAVNTSGLSSVNWATTTFASDPPVPVDSFFTGSPTQTSLYVTWYGDDSGNAATVAVSISTDGTNYILQANVAATAGIYTINDLTPGTHYWIKGRYENPSGDIRPWIDTILENTTDPP